MPITTNSSTKVNAALLAKNRFAKKREFFTIDSFLEEYYGCASLEKYSPRSPDPIGQKSSFV